MDRDAQILIDAAVAMVIVVGGVLLLYRRMGNAGGQEELALCFGRFPRRSGLLGEAWCVAWSAERHRRRRGSRHSCGSRSTAAPAPRSRRTLRRGARRRAPIAAGWRFRRSRPTSTLGSIPV